MDFLSSTQKITQTAKNFTLKAPMQKKSSSSILGRLKTAMTFTRKNLVECIEDVFQGRKEIDSNLLEELESILIGADIGITTTTEILEVVKNHVDRKQIKNGDDIKDCIKSELLRILKSASTHSLDNIDSKLKVILVVGVNGVGKTTTTGKLAKQFTQQNKNVLVCAADTFRAAAVEQLEQLGTQAKVKVIRQKTGADPSAVLFDAINAAKSRHVDILIIDTAGRLHTKKNLMAELEKMKRIAGREVEGAPHEVLLIIDATTGQNGLIQAQEFSRSSGVSGIVLSKLDGTAKGGVIIGIARDLKTPIKYIGIGEQLDDLIPFSPEVFVDSLFD